MKVYVRHVFQMEFSLPTEGWFHAKIVSVS
jgi:hypothetical protein